MNPLSRLLALGLLVVLAALSVMLALPAWKAATAPLPPLEAKPAATAPAHATNPSLTAGRLTAFAERIALPLTLTALVLATGLFLSLALTPTSAVPAKPPLAAEKSEIGALTRLAEKTAAQGEALNRERRGRVRAEEDATLNRELLDRSIEERTQLGRDLHDGLIQSLYAAGLNIESARAIVKTDPDEADTRLERSLQTINRAIRDVRTYIAGLSPERLPVANFATAIDAMTTELGAGREASFELRIDEAAAERLTAEQHGEALQIAREAISNALRHGQAQLVTVRLHEGDGALCLLVQDNGAGFDPAHTRSGGHGLGNLQARARRLGATLRIESSPGAGTRVLLTLPLLRTA